MEFQLLNLNPKGWKTNDCVVRALAGATNTSWEVTYLTLCEIGAKKCRMPNDKQTYEAFLKERGWIKQKMPVWYDAFGKKNRYTVADLAKEYPDKKMVVSVAHHLTFIDKGVLKDLWNCGSKAVGNYWIKEGK